VGLLADGVRRVRADKEHHEHPLCVLEMESLGGRAVRLPSVRQSSMSCGEVKAVRPINPYFRGCSGRPQLVVLATAIGEARVCTSPPGK
jgi:hypothetical protein